MGAYKVADHLPGGDVERTFGSWSHSQRDRALWAEADSPCPRFLARPDAHGLRKHVDGDGLSASFQFLIAAQTK